MTDDVASDVLEPEPAEERKAHLNQLLHVAVESRKTAGSPESISDWDTRIDELLGLLKEVMG